MGSVDEDESKSLYLSTDADADPDPDPLTPNDPRRLEVDGDGLRRLRRLVSRRMLPPKDLRPLLIVDSISVD